MKKQHKALMWVLILVPVTIGGYFIYKYLKGPKIIPPPPKNSPPRQAASPSTEFPMKNGNPKGSDPLVVQLQGMLGVDPSGNALVTDGKFGPKTAAALLEQTGKTQIDSQSDFNAVINQLMAADQQGNNNLSDPNAYLNVTVQPDDYSYAIGTLWK